MDRIAEEWASEVSGAIHQIHAENRLPTGVEIGPALGSDLHWPRAVWGLPVKVNKDMSPRGWRVVATPSALDLLPSTNTDVSVPSAVD